MIIREIMQLPRGTFREIKKHQKTRDLLEELERVRFSGICSISYRGKVSTIVLKSGKCILVEFEMFKGDAAFECLSHAIADKEIDAALSTLDEAQIQLSLEFNTAEQIKKTDRSATASQRPVHQPGHPVPPVIIKNTGMPTGTNLPLSGENFSTPAKRPPEIMPRPLTGKKEPAGNPPELMGSATAPASNEREILANDTAPTDFENDLDMLDSMNLNQMTDKIREDCKNVVKQLHLDHLMDRE